jgi:hypothetical protein
VKVKRHTTWLTSDRWIDLDLVSHGHCAVAPTLNRIQAGPLQFGEQARRTTFTIAVKLEVDQRLPARCSRVHG